MQFDHVPERGKKLGFINEFLTDPQKLKEELAKCDLVCANCHFLRTKKRGISPERLENIRRANQDPKNIAKRRATLSKTNKLPEVRQRRSRAAQEIFNRPDVKKKVQENLSTIWGSPEARARQSQLIREGWARRKAMRG